MRPNPPFLALCGLLLLAAPAAADEADQGIATVTAVPARRGQLPRVLAAYGTASPALESEQSVNLPQDGQVTALFVTQGERITKGEALLRFALAPYSVSAYAQAVTTLRLATSERAHTEALLREKLATRDQLAQAIKTEDDAASALQALQAQGADHRFTDLAAPVDGIVDQLPVAVGDRVAAGTTLLKLIRLDPAVASGLVVTVGVPPDAARLVKPGQPATLTEFGVPDPIPGTIRRIDGDVNPKSHLVDVDIAATAPAALLAGDAYAAAITVGRLDGWLVPHAALQNDEAGDYLMQTDGTHTHRVNVRFLGARGATDVVDGSLDPSQRIVVTGAGLLADGDRVRLTPGPGH